MTHPHPSEPPPAGTNHSTSGTKDSPPPEPPRSRLLIIVVSGVLTLATLAWLEWLAWQSVNTLEQDWQAMTPAQSDLGPQLTLGAAKLRQSLLGFQLSDDEAHRETFTSESNRMRQLLAQAAATAPHGRERELLSRVQQELEVFLDASTGLLEQGVTTVRRDTYREIESTVITRSEPLRRALADLAGLQEDMSRAARQRTDDSLDAIRLVLIASSLVAIGLMGFAGVVVYRGVMAPLQAALGEAHGALARQERLASLGVMAAGVAHEIRNPLTAVKLNIFSLKRALPPTWADHEDLRQIASEINRLDRIIHDFLEFARPSEPRLQILQAGAVVQEARELLRVALEARGVELVLDAQESPELRADPEQLRQVLINLIQNAADSMPQGGKVTLRVSRGASSLLKRSQPAVLLEVIDEGAGIPPEVEPHIFDPFFSTKPHGSGLGLSIASRIAEMQGGHLQYVTRPGHGTTFTLVLPNPSAHERKDPVNRR